MRIWIKGLLAAAAIALLIWLLVGICGFTLDVLNAFNGDSGGRDPMFAEEVSLIAETPVPEQEEPTVYEDNSASWDTSVQTPVDKTAEELAGEAENTP